MNAIKPGTKTRLRILFSVLLCAIIIGTTPRVMREFYYRGAFIHYRGILRLVLLIMLPLLLLSYIAFISELKQSQKKLMLNVLRWNGVILYCAILGFVFFGGDRRDYDYSGLTPNYIPFSSIVKSIRGFQIDGDWKNLIEIFGNLVLLSPFSFLLSFKVHPEKNIRFVCAADCVGMHRDSAAGFDRRGF